MSRYLRASGGNTRKAMTLYRLNLRLSHEMFTIISCFEVGLRNKINLQIQQNMGNDWLLYATKQGGVFDDRRSRFTKSNILTAVNSLGAQYNHNKLVAELGFGFWRYMFAKFQYRVTGRNLLNIFPMRPASTPTSQYNNIFVFNQLAEINNIRNRIAHHEPICFQLNQSIIDTSYVKFKYDVVATLFHWMNIDQADLLYGLDHITHITNKIENI